MIVDDCMKSCENWTLERCRFVHWDTVLVLPVDLQHLVLLSLLSVFNK